MLIRSAFWDDFACLAGRCRHTCCREGWEIDVDLATLKLWYETPGELGHELVSALNRNTEENTRSIRLLPDGVCPYLRPDGLCRIVCELGEDALCDICALHPRFYEDIGVHELSGVGLCCEESVGLLLAQEGPLVFLTEEDEELSLWEVMQAVGIQCPPPGLLQYTPSFSLEGCRKTLEIYAQCEVLHPEWTQDLEKLSQKVPDAAAAAEKAVSQNLGKLGSLYQRIFEYILYRQLEFAETYGVPVLIRYARESTDFVLLWSAVTGDLPECLRRWSCEIEYSTDNVDLLLQEAAKAEAAAAAASESPDTPLCS